jgi:hypothetical protein
MSRCSFEKANGDAIHRAQTSHLPVLSRACRQNVHRLFKRHRLVKYYMDVLHGQKCLRKLTNVLLLLCKGILLTEYVLVKTERL